MFPFIFHLLQLCYKDSRAGLLVNLGQPSQVEPHELGSVKHTSEKTRLN